MAGVRLEFAQFGHFDYFNIYRNQTSTEIIDLDQPLATCDTMYFVDLTAVPFQEYYYRVGTVRDNLEEFSDEIFVIAVFEFDPPYNLQGAWNNTTQSVDLTWEFGE